MRRFRISMLVAWVVGLGSLSTAWAQGSRYRPVWMPHTSQNPFRYWVDARNQSPAGLALSQVQGSVEAAWGTWDAVSCASTGFQAMGLSPALDPRDPYDVYNVSAVWITSASDPYYQELLGPETPSASIPLTFQGVLKQCDIYLNGVDMKWSTATPTPADAFDVQSRILHEAGHCQGLDDTYNSDFGVRDEVMYVVPQRGVAKRGLAARDSESLCARYPLTGAVGAPCGTGNNCGGVAGLKCVTPNSADGGAGFPRCAKGCAVGTNADCGFPFVCTASTAFAPAFNGACLPPPDDVTPVGAPCNLDSECGAALARCIQQSSLPSGFAGWSQGYCSQACGVGQPACPQGTSCVDIGPAGQRCLKDCRLGSGDCRPGYSCVQATELGAPVCVPSCHGDTDCNAIGSSAFQCRTCDGTCLAKQNPVGQLGDACSKSSDCGTGQVCAWFSGTATAQSQGICSQACNRSCMACPNGSTCHPVGPRGERFCLKDCVSGTCAANTQCGFLPTGRGCLPQCADDKECPAGLLCRNGACAPNEDGGCLLCADGDGGRPQLPAGGVTGGGKTSPGGGCGCGASGAPGATWALALLALWAGRRAGYRRRGLGAGPTGG